MLYRWSNWLLAVAAAAVLVFIVTTVGNSGPHLRSAASNWTSVIQAISGLLVALTGLLGVIGKLRGADAAGKSNTDAVRRSSRHATRFREASRNYNGSDSVIVEIFDGLDEYKRPMFRSVLCYPIDSDGEER